MSSNAGSPDALLSTNISGKSSTCAAHFTNASANLSARSASAGPYCSPGIPYRPGLGYRAARYARFSQSMVSSSAGTFCARLCSSVLTTPPLSRLAKSAMSWAEPPTTSSSATPQVRNMADLVAISTTCWQCQTAVAGKARSPSRGCRSLRAATSSSFACCNQRGACDLSTMRFLTDEACTAGFQSPSSCGCAMESGGRAMLLDLAALMCVACCISLSNSSNQEPCIPPLGS
mmetsp:Transcript_61911/g.199648  ORF Transcript_61911/g.199648 Transcript_61911/m.199648 type:complete len:232 (-) Transcript_61911:656-1351(-)